MESLEADRLTEQSQESDSEENDTRSDLTDNRYSSAKLLLSSIQKEYEVEASRAKNLETRTGMFIAFSGVLLVFISNNIKLTNLDMAMKVTVIQALPYWFYLSCLGITLFSLLAAIYFFIRVVSVTQYKRIDVSAFHENVSCTEEAVAAALVEVYSNVIADNIKVNNDKVKNFKNGLILIQVALVLNLLTFGSAWLIGKI